MPLAAMFGLRFLLDESSKICTYVADAYVHVKRDLELMYVFQKIEKNILKIFKKCWPKENHETNRLQVIAVMPTIAFETLLAGKQDVDGCAVFCKHNARAFSRFQQVKDNEEFRQSVLRTNMRLLLKINALTDPVKFEEQKTCFLQTHFCVNLPELVQKHVMDYLQRYYSTKMTVIWVSRRPDVLRDGVNCMSHTRICFNDAMALFDKQVAIAVEKKRARQAAKAAAAESL